jgi:hypothetical protein
MSDAETSDDIVRDLAAMSPIRIRLWTNGNKRNVYSCMYCACYSFDPDRVEHASGTGGACLWKRANDWRNER